MFSVPAASLILKLFIATDQPTFSLTSWPSASESATGMCQRDENLMGMCQRGGATHMSEAGNVLNFTGGKTGRAGIGAGFGLDSAGAVYFVSAVPGSSSAEAFADGRLRQ